MKKEFTGPRSHKGWKTVLYTTLKDYESIHEEIKSGLMSGNASYHSAENI